jgi:uncharacterized membrane protein YfcA
MDIFNVILIGLSAVAGGLVNAITGGGTLITFPMLTAIGIPPVAVNVTNTGDVVQITTNSLTRSKV